VLRACITNSLLTFLCYDQYLCAAGLLEQVDFDFELGTITAARHPAAVSTSLGLVVALVQAQYLNAKMLSTDAGTARHTFGVSGCSTLIYNHTFGIDQYGTPTANFPLDGIVGGLGAFPWRDGLDHGGTMSSTMNPVGSVESMEREVPMLYLYRREASDSGGHGRWRGGACIVSAMVGHHSPEHFISSGGLAQSVTQGVGLLGGWPGTGGAMWRAEDCDIRGWLESGRVPGTPDELREMAPDGDLAPPKVFNNRLLESDVFEVIPNPGAGYGDPMLREPETVATEAGEGRLTHEEARAIYGVDLDSEGNLATGHEELRAERMRSRLAEAKPPLEAAEGTLTEREGLALATVAFGKDASGTGALACAHCSQSLAPRAGNYRLGAARLELPMTDLGANFLDPHQQVGHTLIFRSYLCPSCGTALDGEVCKPGDAPHWDVRLAAD
jgi:N-methylhydantoinase B